MELQDMQLVKNNIWQWAKIGSGEMGRLIIVCGKKTLIPAFTAFTCYFRWPHNSHYTSLHSIWMSVRCCWKVMELWTAINIQQRQGYSIKINSVHGRWNKTQHFIMWIYSPYVRPNMIPKSEIPTTMSHLPNIPTQ